MRAFFFQQVESLPSNAVKLSDIIYGKKHPLRSLLVMGLFFEGLASFQLARRIKENAAMWIANGDFILTKMKSWSVISGWNWENKVFLLEAEKMHTLGLGDSAEALYKQAIRSAHQHNFIHEQAIASELAGMFYYERALHTNAYDLLVHSVGCYNKWGAHAVAKRVEAFVEAVYGPDFDSNHTLIDDILARNDGLTRKRDESGDQHK